MYCKRLSIPNFFESLEIDVAKNLKLCICIITCKIHAVTGVHYIFVQNVSSTRYQ